MVIEGDIMLYGQGSKKQKLLASMANSASEAQASTLDFETWLKMVIQGHKAIKLHFKTVEPMELTLQILREYKDQVG